MTPAANLTYDASSTASELRSIAAMFEAMAGGCASTPLGHLSFWGSAYRAEAAYIRKLAEIAETEAGRRA